MILKKTTLYVYLYVRRHKTFHIQTFQLLQAPTFFGFEGRVIVSTLKLEIRMKVRGLKQDQFEAGLEVKFIYS